MMCGLSPINALRRSISDLNSPINLVLLSSLIVGLFIISLARLEYLSVERVSL